MVRHVAFTPDGQTLISLADEVATDNEATQWDKNILIKHWSVPTGKDRSTWRRVDWTRRPAALSSDGRTMMVALGKEIKIYDGATGQERASLPGQKWAATSLVFSADGKVLATDVDLTSIRLWDTETAKERATFVEDSGYVACLALSSCGKLLASGRANHGKISVRDTSTGKIVATILSHDTAPPSNLAFSSKGMLASANCYVDTRDQPVPVEVKLWDVSEQLRAAGE
jgi:WD40 repeat protein